MKKYFKRFTTVCLTMTLVVNLFCNIRIHAIGTNFFLGNGQLAGAPPIVDRIYNIKSTMDTNRYFQALNNGTTSQTSIKTALYNGAAYQEWKICKVEGTDNVYTLQDINSGKYLSILASASTSGVPAYIFDYSNAPGQHFKIVQHQNANGEGLPYYKILTQCSNYELALGVDISTHTILQIDKDSPYTRMILEEASFAKGIPDGYNFIQNVYFNTDDNNFLSIEPATGVATLSGFGTKQPKCNFIYIGNNYYIIMLNDSFCLSVTNSFDDYNKQVVGYSVYSGNNNQHWKVIADGDCFRFQPQSSETDNLFLYCDLSRNLILDSSENISRSKWRRYINDIYFDEVGSYLCGVNDSRHPINHIDWIPATMTKLHLKENTTINYDQIKINSGYTESVDVNSFEDGFSSSTLTIFRGHGGYGTESYLLLSPILINGKYTESTAVKYYCSEMDEIDVSNVSCALFITCHSAEGCYDNNSFSNFVTEGINNGITCVIGFDDTLNCEYAADFLNKFVELYTGVDEDGIYNPANSNNYYEAFRETINILGVDNNMPFLSTSTYKIYYSNGLVTEYYNY